MTGILSQYLTRTILASTALVLVVLLALAGLFEFIAQLDDVEGNYQTPQAILYAALRLPNLAFQMFPVSALIGALLGLGGLAANSEIIVMRSSGLSVTRLAGMAGIAGLVMLTVTGLLGEFIGPPLDNYARNMRTEARYGNDDNRFGNETWVKDGAVYLHLERVNSEFDFGNLYVYRFNSENELASIAKAENAGISADDRWLLENFKETRFQRNGVQAVESSVAIESFEVNSEMLVRAMAKSTSLSARGLLTYIDYLKRNDLDSGAYESELWHRVSRTMAVMIMPMLALAFVFGSLRTGGAGARLMIGVGICLVYYLASEMLANSGQLYGFNPAVVAWLPTMALLLVTVFVLARIR